MATQPLVYNKQIIQEPQDIGNYLPKGVAIGPSTSPGGQVPGFMTDASSLTFENALSYGYGNGLLLGPVCTYRIFPATTVSITNSFNLTSGGGLGTKVPFINVNTISPRPAQYIKRKSGTIFLQMDYPRTVSAYRAGYDEGSTTCSVTALIRGIDGWGRKVTTSVTVSNDGTYPGIPGDEGTPVGQSASALFQVYEIEISEINVGDGGTGAAVVFGAGDQFGLPYKLTDIGHVQNYSQWWQQIDNAPSDTPGANGIWANYMGWSEVSGNPATPFYYTNDTTTSTYSVTPYQLSFPKQLITGFNGADQNFYPPNPTPPAVYPGVPAPETTDVRGLFSPQNLLGYEYDEGPPIAYDITAGDFFDWQGPVTISYYVPGADTFIWKYAQMMNQYQQAAVLDGSVADGAWDGFGNSFYYNTNGNTTNECEPSLELLIGPVPYSDF